MNYRYYVIKVALVLLFVIIGLLLAEGIKSVLQEHPSEEQAVVEKAAEEVVEEEVIQEEVIEDEECIVVDDYMLITAKFNDYFIDNYQYEDSKNYMFALNIDGRYYNVYRNEFDGVSNSAKDGLLGAISAYDINNGSGVWLAPLHKEVKVANKAGNYGYKYHTFDKHSRRTLRLSPTKETSDVATLTVDVVDDCMLRTYMS